MCKDIWICTFDVCTWYIHSMNTFYIGMYMKMYGKTNFNCTYMEYTKNYDFLFVYTCLYIACTWYKPVCTWFIHVHSVSYLENAKPFPAQCDVHCELACNPFMIGLDSAYVQESAIWYIHCLEAYIHAKNHRGRWSAFLWLFSQKTFKHVCQLLYRVERCWAMYEHAKDKKSQESWPPATVILSVYIRF